MIIDIPTKKHLKVREGNTGILYIIDQGCSRDKYIPNYDLEETRSLLLEFQQLKNTEGRFLKDNYWHEGLNWYPSMVSFLYWHVFFLYVKYKPLVYKFIDNEIEYQFENDASFKNLISFFKGNYNHKTFKKLIFYTLVNINNKLMIKKYPYSLMVFRFSFDDFRSVEINKILHEQNVKYIQIVPPGRIVDVLKFLFQKQPYYYYGTTPNKNIFNYKYNLQKYDKYKKYLFQKAINFVEVTISRYIKEFNRHLNRLKNSSIKIFYGFDDCNGYIFPILYACSKNNIKSIGHQHGAYVKRHAGYIMEGIEKENYKWFDKLIVWGKYWKDHLLSISNIYNPENIVIGSNKLTRDYSSGKNINSPLRNIFIPYEFTTNTYKVGKYIAKFIDLGYNIYFKPRNDERLSDQLATYCLSERYHKKINIIEKIDKTSMNNIDIVAGTMTTLVYELLPYNKIIWILETEYKHLEDLVEEGYAHKVKYEDLETLGDSYFIKTSVDANYFFYQESLEKTLKKQVLSQL